VSLRLLFLIAVSLSAALILQRGLLAAPGCIPDVCQEWSDQIGGTSDDEGLEVEVDSAGSAIAGGTTYSTGNGDLLIAKYFLTGQQQWLRTYGGAAGLNDQLTDIAIDSQDNILVVGVEPIAPGVPSYRLVKYDPGGNQLWTQSINNGSGEARLAIGPADEVFVSGSVQAACGNAKDIVVTKYDSSGLLLWDECYNGTANREDFSRDIASDSFGNVYVVGQSDGLLAPFPGNSYDFVTMKFSSTGTQDWAQRFDHAQLEDHPWSIAINSAGQVFVTGWTADPVSGAEFATVAYDSNGSQIWTDTYGTTGSNGFDEARDVIVGPSNEVYVTGRLNDVHPGGNDQILIRYNASSGQRAWISRLPGTGPDSGHGESLALGPTGDIYVGGRSYDSGNNQSYLSVMRIDEAGVIAWRDTIPSPSTSDVWESVAVDSLGAANVVGSLHTSGLGEKDILIARFGSNPADNCPEVENPSQEDNDGQAGAFAGYPAWVRDGAGLDGSSVGGDLCDENDDNNGCDDVGEPALTPARDALNPWDFADMWVPALPTSGTPAGGRSGAITLADASAAIIWVGTMNDGPPNTYLRDYDADVNSNGVEDGAEYDRAAAGVGLSGPPSGAVTLADVSVILAQVGDVC